MKTNTRISAALAAGLAGAAIALSATPASATNGYFGICTGAKNCGMAGAGVALPQDSTSGAVNPALMGRIQDQVTVSPGWFHPVRSLDRTGATNKAGIVPTSVQVDETSMMEHFIEGSAGFNYQTNSDFTLGLSAAGSGGMHTKYATPRSIGGQGAGETSVRYRLAHLKPTVTWSPNDWSVYGASINVGWSDFKSNMGTNPNFVETAGANHTETALGLGFTLGGLWDINDKVSLGASLSSPTWFQHFDSYGDLFAGSLDTPANGAVGIVYHATPDTDIAFDVKYIAWGTVFAIANTPRQTGEPGGGFGWESQPVFMLGAQHRVNEAFTVRAGYNYGPSPIPEDKIFANALFPAITEHHIAVGATYEPSPKWELSTSFFYAFKNTLTDDGTGDFFSYAGQGVAVDMYQMGAQIGITYNF